MYCLSCRSSSSPVLTSGSATKEARVLVVLVVTRVLKGKLVAGYGTVAVAAAVAWDIMPMTAARGWEMAVVVEGDDMSAMGS